MASTLRPPREAAVSEPKEEAAAFAPSPANTPTPTTGFNGNRRVPEPVNEPVRSYAPGSPERVALKERLKSMSSERMDIPLIIGGKEIRTGELAEICLLYTSDAAD